MNQAVAVLAVAIGGAAGSVLRYLLGSWFVERVGAAFPWGTFVINLSGAFAIGIVLQLAQTRFGLNPYARLFFATGILGGYTTFSTYAYETLMLARGSAIVQSAAYGFGSIIAGMIAAYLGTVVTRLACAAP